ncbi:protein of unknown function (DU1801) [Promicromonospora umidemergens]|uniref:YdhG-like domain-containing protein n=1 Tax=Promicromonospora umidemergens TaxID=629679 RepID=A0ABP8XJH4_9MICO|nr:DUF1801 domain-containing protein [Promicromonospora umidemergens]MCP2282193.1 protein of unknown function (DU1801) [Promicromonospora umidemergens]
MSNTSKAGTSKAGEDKRAESSAGVFSEQERAALKARSTELKEEARDGRGAKKAAKDEAAVLSKIAEMESPDRELAARVHDIVTAAAPELAPKLWYGQPAYARDGEVVCFFRSGQVDKERYSTFGFSVAAALDEDGGMWPTSYALTGLDKAGEAAIAELVKKALR